MANMNMNMNMHLAVKSLRVFACILAAACWMAATESKPDGQPKDTPAAADTMVGEMAGQLRNDNELKMKLCWCPRGKFMMGSPKPEQDRSDSEDQVTVTLTVGFWLGKYEVTQEEFDLVVRMDLDRRHATHMWGKPPNFFSANGNGKRRVAATETNRFPVENVSHDEALEFCAKLTDHEQRAGRLSKGWIYTLPTEAQWEYACRAGTDTPFSFGELLNGAEANCLGESPDGADSKDPFLGRTTNVGSFAGNAWGLHDMHGNVWEWCRDAYASKLPGETDPRVTTGSSRVLRGGSWNSATKYCRSAHRSWYVPSFRDNDLGFRVACIPSGNR